MLYVTVMYTTDTVSIEDPPELFISLDTDGDLSSLSGRIHVQCQAYLAGTLNVIKEIKRFQKVALQKLSLVDVGNDCSHLEQLMLEIFTLGEKTTHLTLSFCNLPTTVWKHLAEQLPACDKLEMVKISDIRDVPEEFLQGLLNIK